MSREMKDSGIEWIGQIPQHWIALPNKHLMKKLKMIPSRYNNEPILSLTMDGVIVRDLDAGGKMPASFDGYQKISKGNLLMCLFDIDVTPRCIGLIKQDGVTSPAYSQFVLNAGNYAPYYYYLYLYLDNDKLLLPLAKNLRHSLTEDVLGEIPMIQPPLSEQQSIANYLDFKCSQIDLLSANIKQQIEKLGEYRKALITQAVTKGLDPDVEIKDSGIELIGSIPKHWTTPSMKRLITFKAGKNLTSEEIDSVGKYPVYGGNGLRGYFDRFNISGTNILVGRQGALAGNVHLTSGDLWATDHALVSSFHQDANKTYVFYLLATMNLNRYATNTAAQPGLAASFIENLKIPLAPLEEQMRIADYLDSQCSQIDSIIKTKNEALSMLLDYKKSLIFDYVTGKREVPDPYRKDGSHE